MIKGISRRINGSDRSKTLFIVSMLLSLLSLQSCSTYSNNFGCSDAKGACCTPMHVVDRMISSGEIGAKIEKPAKKKDRIYKTDKEEQEEDNIFPVSSDIDDCVLENKEASNV